MSSNGNDTYRLKNIGIPAMKSVGDLAKELRLSSRLLNKISSQPDHFYKVYFIPKKSGDLREIAQPNRVLKGIQAWILRNILDKLSSSTYSKGFEKGTSILDNASPHVGSSYLLNMDLENFFPSISFYKVYGIFKSIGFNEQLCTILSKICTIGGRLPQGAPTSPKLSNLVCARLDARIQGYAGPKGIIYTRYADDLTLSAQTARKITNAKIFIKRIIEDEDLIVNENKTKVLGTKQRKEVTGLVVSQDSVGIGREKLRKLRSELHHLFTGRIKNASHANGLLSFIYSVDKSAYRKMQAYVSKLRRKHPEATWINLHMEKGYPLKKSKSETPVSINS